jgi:hypothetical protein
LVKERDEILRKAEQEALIKIAYKHMKDIAIKTIESSGKMQIIEKSMDNGKKE